MADLVLVDLPNLLMRLWYGAGCRTEADLDRLVTATRAVLSRLVEEEHARHLVAAEDRPNCWRYDIHPGYKGGPGNAEDRKVEPHRLVELMRPHLETWGVCRAWADREEADDVVATLAHQAQLRGLRVVLYTKDSDQVQCVRERVTLRWPGSRDKKGHQEPDVRHTPEKVRELYGVKPEDYPALKALVAYPKDNLRGLLGLEKGTRCGFTEKRARELLNRHPLIDILDPERGVELTDREAEWVAAHAHGIDRIQTIATLNHQADVRRSGPTGVGHLKF